MAAPEPLQLPGDRIRGAARGSLDQVQQPQDPVLRGFVGEEAASGVQLRDGHHWSAQRLRGTDVFRNWSRQVRHGNLPSRRQSAVLG